MVRLCGFGQPLMSPGHPVGRGIDDVMDVAGVVALQDPDGDAVVGVEPGHSLGRQPAPPGDTMPRKTGNARIKGEHAIMHLRFNAVTRGLPPG